MAKPKQLEIVETDEAESLNAALGLAHKIVTVRGESVRVEEFEIAHLPVLLKVVRDLAGAMGGSVTTDALMRSGESGIEIAMLATGKPREWFNRMPLGDGLALYAAIIEANASFFTHLPDLAGLGQLVQGMLGPATNGRA